MDRFWKAFILGVILAAGVLALLAQAGVDLP